uniref:R13L1/DRL21-like LRR repeat region domain-containing protein n=1 Tax=Fagus sylvatica TaxID=28930 RepID=A0A2N9H2Y7_FAGSY
MPPQMGKLKNLRKLSVFVVNKNGGSNIGELGELQQLSGKLSISNLENVHCIKDATEVMLKDKQDLSELELKWKDDHDTDDSEKERNVLEQLCPPKNLKSLTIVNYVGTKFPNWLGDPSFRNMVSIVLKGCKNCFICPPLGQLPYLKKLEIEGFKGEKVGPEFYGNDSSAIEPRFRSLEYLSFENMQEWQEWVIFEDGVSSLLLHFLRLRLSREFNVEAKIQLTSGHYYPSLESIYIDGDGHHSLWSFPLELFPKLKSIEIYNCENLNSFSASEGCHSNLTSLSIDSCPNLESLPVEGLPSNLESLDITFCDKLFSRRREWRLHSLRKLRTFRIDTGCEEAENFPEEAGFNTSPLFKAWSLINNCPKLQCLPEEGLPTSLQSLFIVCCPKLQCLPEEGLPTSLSHLSISGCPLLEKRCEEEKGEDWDKIAAIPYIEINRRTIRSPRDRTLLSQMTDQRQEAINSVIGLSGVYSCTMSMDMDKDKTFTVTGDIDPVDVVNKLRKLCHTEILSVGPVKE